MNRVALSSVLSLALLGSLTPALAAPEQGAADPPAAIEIRPAAPVAAPRVAAMRAWHAAYRREMAPVRRSLALVLAEIAGGRTRSLGRPCRDLGEALAAADFEEVLPVPDFAADVHLKQALGGLYRAAAACLFRRPGELIHHLDQAGAAFANTALALRRYGLEP